MTHIASFPFFSLGNANTKSMVIISHFHSRICSGCNGHVGLWCSTLICCHIPHFDTYLVISLFMLGHQ
jgi:hypothetical protein